MSGRSDNHNRQEQNRRRSRQGLSSSVSPAERERMRESERRSLRSDTKTYNPYYNLTPGERYIQQKRKNCIGRIIFWVILVEVVALGLGAMFLFMPKEDPELEELITKKVKIAYETEPDRVVTYGLAVPKPNVDEQILTVNEW